MGKARELIKSNAQATMNHVILPLLKRLTDTETRLDRLERVMVDAVIKSLLKRVGDLEIQTATLERSLQARSYLGVFDGHTVYCKENLVTFQGSVWVCKADTTSDRPGTSAAWQLAVKKGRDAREARDLQC